MPHLPPLANGDAVPATRVTLESLEAKLGQVPNMYRTLAHAPKVLSAAVSMAQAIRCELSPKVRELAYLMVTVLTDCHVCRHYHETFGRNAGLTDAQIRDFVRFEKSDAFTPDDKDVLRFAVQWSADGRVRQEVLDRLSRTLSAGHLVILAATVAQANLTCRFNNVFGVELP